jgi:putative zinc finger/helix-turn-helix YgiT family protein
MAVTTLDNHLHRFCGGRYQAAEETVTVRLSGMQAQVTRGLFRCAKCGDEQRTVEQREAAERAAVDRMRATHALLTPREVRQLREALGLTTAQLGELLHGVPKGIVEGWERGRYLQNRDADALLRSLRDRETLERRAARAGVTLPTPVGGAAPSAPGAEAGAEGAAAAEPLAAAGGGLAPALASADAAAVPAGAAATARGPRRAPSPAVPAR